MFEILRSAPVVRNSISSTSCAKTGIACAFTFLGDHIYARFDAGEVLSVTTDRIVILLWRKILTSGQCPLAESRADSITLPTNNLNWIMVDQTHFERGGFALLLARDLIIKPEGYKKSEKKNIDVINSSVVAMIGWWMIM